MTTTTNTCSCGCGATTSTNYVFTMPTMAISDKLALLSTLIESLKYSVETSTRVAVENRIKELIIELR